MFAGLRTHEPHRNAAREQRDRGRHLVAPESLSELTDLGDAVVLVSDFVMAFRVIGRLVPVVARRVGQPSVSARRGITYCPRHASSSRSWKSSHHWLSIGPPNS